MRLSLVTPFLANLARTAAAKGTPKRVGYILATGLAVAAVVLASKAEASNLWIAEGGGGSPAETASNVAIYGPDFVVTNGGKIWLYPNKDRAKGGMAVYGGTYWDSYFPRSSPLFSGWSGAMKAIGASNRGELKLGNNEGTATRWGGSQGYGGYITGSRLEFDTGGPTYDYFHPFGAGSRGLWPD